MPNHLKVYMGSVTAGARDGVEVSSEHSFTSPISFTLDSSIAESKYAKCAIRCDTGYETLGETVISFVHWDGTTYQTVGGAMSKFKLALDDSDLPTGTRDSIGNSLTWHDSITINSKIDDTNTIFWIKASSTLDEASAQYADVALSVNGVIVSVDVEG